MEPLSWSGAPADRILTTALDEELEEYRLLAYLQRVEAQYLSLIHISEPTRPY